MGEQGLELRKKITGGLAILTLLLFCYSVSVCSSRTVEDKKSAIVDRQINQDWERYKYVTDKINNEAYSYIVTAKLREGDPIPPSIFREVGEIAREGLEGDKEQVVTWTRHLGDSPNDHLEFKVYYGNSVPIKGQNYAYCIMEIIRGEQRQKKYYPLDDHCVNVERRANRVLEAQASHL
jgi:hypothetical protein